MNGCYARIFKDNLVPCKSPVDILIHVPFHSPCMFDLFYSIIIQRTVNGEELSDGLCVMAG
jgi:hypothetical protein